MFLIYPRVLVLLPHFFLSFYFPLLFFPWFGQFYHHHPEQNKKLKLLSKHKIPKKKKIQPNEWPHQNPPKPNPKKPAPNPTRQPEPSGPPQEVKCYSPSSTNILVSWRPPPVELQNGIITQYAIQYAATEGEDATTRQIVNIPPESTQYLLENLEKWTEYRVTVTAHTDVGAGPESLPQVIRTEEDGMCSLKQSSSCNSSLPFLTYPVKY